MVRGAETSPRAAVPALLIGTGGESRNRYGDIALRAACGFACDCGTGRALLEAKGADFGGST
jgi:hypothetical protein